LFRHISAASPLRAGGTIIEPFNHVNKKITICDTSFTFPTKTHTFSTFILDYSSLSAC
jgi:hypothetical protein